MLPKIRVWGFIFALLTASNRQDKSKPCCLTSVIEGRASVPWLRALYDEKRRKNTGSKFRRPAHERKILQIVAYELGLGKYVGISDIVDAGAQKLEQN